MTAIPHPPTSADLSRRGFLQLSGAGLVAAVALGACGDSGSGQTSTTTTTTKDFARDTLLLRTATSLELLHAELYSKVAESKLLKTAAAVEVGDRLLANHKEQAELFTTETTKLGGEVYTQPNPSLARTIEARLMSLQDEASILAFALETERVAGATYQTFVGQFSVENIALNQVVMSVGAASARAAAVLAGFVGQPPIAAAFQGTTGAIAAGTGI